MMDAPEMIRLAKVYEEAAKAVIAEPGAFQPGSLKEAAATKAAHLAGLSAVAQAVGLECVKVCELTGCILEGDNCNTIDRCADAIRALLAARLPREGEKP